MYRPNRIGPSCFMDVGSADTQIVSNNIASGIAAGGTTSKIPAGIHSAVLPVDFNSQCFFSNAAILPGTVTRSMAFGIALTGLEDRGIANNPYHLTVSGACWITVADTFNTGAEYFTVFPIIGALPTTPVALDGSTDGSDFNDVTKWQILPGTHQFVIYGSAIQIQASFNEDIVLGDFGLSSVFTTNPIFLGWAFIYTKTGGATAISSSWDCSAFKYLNDLPTFDPTR